MNIYSIISLVFATAVLGLSPGPAVFATIGRSLSCGPLRTGFFILGIIIGDILFAFLAMAGLASIAVSYDYIFLILKIIGGGYLIYIGVNSFKHAKVQRINEGYKEKRLQLIISGFLLTSTNPKDLLFFVGFLPAFIDLKNINLSDMVIVSITIAVTFIFTLSIFSVLAHRMKMLLQSDNAVTNLNRISGSVMILVGLFVIFAEHL